MSFVPSDAELEAYLDESLSPSDMAAIESALRQDPKMLSRLVAINQRRSSGVHTLGEMWRRHRLTCFSREQLGSYLLGVLEAEESDYVKFHVEQIGCRVCGANLEDLRRQRKEAAEVRQNRRRKYFQSSAGLLRDQR